MTLIFDVPRPSVAIQDSAERFPVRRIYCVGRNYADHAREMGNDPDREPPFFFQKPGDAVVGGDAEIAYPPATRSLHHEIELVVAIGQGGKDVPVEAALAHVWGYGVGVDLTRRDMQAKAKEMRRPWDMSKGFDASAQIGALHPVAQVGHPEKGEIRYSVNGILRQIGDLSDQIWRVDEVIASLSGLVTLEPGDLIMTGTPAGVDALVPGDRAEGRIEGLGSLSLKILDPA